MLRFKLHFLISLCFEIQVAFSDEIKVEVQVAFFDRESLKLNSFSVFIVKRVIFY